MTQMPPPPSEGPYPGNVPPGPAGAPPPPGPGGPGYSAPPPGWTPHGQPPPRGGGGKGPLALVAVVVAVAIVGGGAFFLLSGGDDDDAGSDDTASDADGGTSVPNGGSPEDVARSLFEARNDADCTSMLERTLPDAWADLDLPGASDYDEALDQCESNMALLETQGVAVEFIIHDTSVVSESGDRATVVVDATQENSDGVGEESVRFDQELTLVEQSDGWKVEGVAEPVPAGG